MAEEKDPESKKPVSSPWPSARKSESPAAPATAPAEDTPGRAAWAAPLSRLDKAWTRLEAKLCAVVLVAEVLTLTFWISMKALSSSGTSGGGQLYRALFTALVLGVAGHFIMKDRKHHRLAASLAAAAGFVIGFKLWGNAGKDYFANLVAWMQNSSLLVFFGGVGEVAKRLTLWLALLGASVATGQGKHINVDVVMRFLGKRARVPVAVLGWMTAAIVSLTAAWGFFDDLAVEDFHAPTTQPCTPGDSKKCPVPAGVKIDHVEKEISRDTFLAFRQISLDLKTAPKALSGQPYNKWLHAAEWNAWVHEGDWASHFSPEDVKALELPADYEEAREPAVTNVPGSSDRINSLLIPVLNLIFPFGLFVIAIRFVLRSILAITGWVKVDPNAAHGEDEELVHAHESSGAVSEHGGVDVPNPKAARAAFLTIGGIVAVLGAAGGALVAIVVALALLGTPLFAIMGGASELAWLTHHDPEQQFLRRLAPEVFGSRFAGSPILTTIPLFTFIGYLMAESKTPERLVRTATAWVGWMPGGLAIVCVLASAVFTLFTGGSGVTIIAVGGLLLPALRKNGYSEKFSLGLVTTGGSLGLLLPFALPLLIYAMVTGLDFQLLNKAVMLPGALVLLLLAGYCAWIGAKEKIPRTTFNAGEALRATNEFQWEIYVFFLLVAAITTAMADIDEAAGLVALYTLGVEVFIYRDLSLKKDLVRIAKSSMALAGAVILILAMANALINYVVQEHLPDKVLDAMLKLGLDQTWQFLIVMNVFLLVLGMVMDGLSAILVAVPLVLPFAAHFGLGPFHVAIMFVLNLEIAFSAPPLGLNLFISSFRFNRPVVSLYRIALPFVGLLALGLLLIMYVPRISNQLVLGDIADWRARAEREKRTPREAWLLECVQQDRSNPLPCSEEDKKRYPNGAMPEPVATVEVKPVDAGPPSEDEDLENMIKGDAKDGGAKEAGAAPGNESDEDLENMIKGGGKDAGAADAAADAAPKKKAPPPGQETDEDLENMIKGKP